MTCRAIAPLTLLSFAYSLPVHAGEVKKRPERVIHVPPAASAQPLQRAIDACREAGGGTVILEPGTHCLDRALRFRDAARIALVGRDEARLQLAPQVVFVAAQAAAEGQSSIEIGADAALHHPCELEVHAPGRTDTDPDGRRRQIPYFDIGARKVEAGRLILRQPLFYPVPKGTRITTAFNAIEVTGTSHDLSFHNLTIDGRRDRWPIRPGNHTRHCGLYAVAGYAYDKGPVADPIKGVVITRVTIRNFHHRGIALYNAADCLVADCTIEDTGAEAIDFDHFVFRARAVNCRLRRAPVGVELNDATCCTVAGTVIEDCHRGINLWRWCVMDDLNVANVFAGNTIRRAAAEAIRIAAATSRSSIVANTIERCPVGIRLAGDDSLVQGNGYRDCAQPLAVAGRRNRVIDDLQ